MFELLEKELEEYTKKHFGDVVFEYVFKNNTELFLTTMEEADSKVENLENKIAKLFSMSRESLEDLQLEENSTFAKEYVSVNRVKEETIFEAKEMHKIMTISGELFEYGTTLHKVADDSRSRSFHDIDRVKNLFSNTPFNFTCKVLDYKTFRDAKIKALNNEIEAIKSNKKWTMKHIETITASKLELEALKKEVLVFKFEIVPLTCERAEYDFDVIKYVVYKNKDVLPISDVYSYNAVYEGTEFYFGCALEEKEISSVLEKIDLSRNEQVIKINDDCELRVSRKV